MQNHPVVVQRRYPLLVFQQKVKEWEGEGGALENNTADATYLSFGL